VDAHEPFEAGRQQFDAEALREWIYQRWRNVAIVAAVAAAVLLVGYLSLRPVGAGRPIEEVLPRAVRPSVVAPEPVVVVHVSGAVKVPGVYRLAQRARVTDLVRAAGGFIAEADANRVNLASMLKDGDQVHIPVVDETPAPVGADEGGPVDINRAPAVELETLPGIGPTLARAIVQHRNRYGEFGSIEALNDVPGIGPAKVARLSDLTTF